MEKKSKGSKSLRGMLLKMMGPSGSQTFLSFLLRPAKNQSFTFPVNNKSIKEVIIILPCEELEVIYQLHNVIALSILFKNSSINVFCEQSVSTFIKMIPGLNVIEFDNKERLSISSSFRSKIKEIRGQTDLCILLNRSPDPAFLYLAEASGAPVRAGYQGAGRYPFINIHVIPDKTNSYLREQNFMMAKLFGAKPVEIRWSIAKKTVDELQQLFNEFKFTTVDKLIGIDALFLIRKFGLIWTSSLLEGIKGLKKGTVYLYVQSDPTKSELDWLSQQTHPVINSLPASRTAALVSRSKVIITGNTILYALAGTVNSSAVGFFSTEEIKTYCPQSSTLKGITFQDCDSTEQAVKLISSFL